MRKPRWIEAYKISFADSIISLVHNIPLARLRLHTDTKPHTHLVPLLQPQCLMYPILQALLLSLIRKKIHRPLLLIRRQTHCPLLHILRQIHFPLLLIRRQTHHPFLLIRRQIHRSMLDRSYHQTPLSRRLGMLIPYTTNIFTPSYPANSKLHCDFHSKRYQKC